MKWLRRPDPRIAGRIMDALGAASSVLNVGAGAGSYEPADRFVVAVEPSRVMLAQRPPGAAPAIRAAAEQLPVPSASFEAVLAILPVHHCSNRQAGYAELCEDGSGDLLQDALTRLQTARTRHAYTGPIGPNSPTQPLAG